MSDQCNRCMNTEGLLYTAFEAALMTFWTEVLLGFDRIFVCSLQLGPKVGVELFDTKGIHLQHFLLLCA